MSVLDTDHVSLLQWGADDQAQRLRSRLQAVDEEVAVTIVSYEEQTRGWLAYVARARTLGQQVEAGDIGQRAGATPQSIAPLPRFHHGKNPCASIRGRPAIRFAHG